MGGFFTVNVSFWLGTDYRQLISSWEYDMLGMVIKGVDISAGGADLVRNGVALGTLDTPMTATYRMSADFPTIYNDGWSPDGEGQFAEPGVGMPRLSAIFHWGDSVTSVDVVPDENGVVHCEDTHIYAEPGKYTPSVELVLDTTSTIGVANSDMLDIRYRAGAMEVTVAGSTVTATAGLPGGMDGLTATWTLTKSGEPARTVTSPIGSADTLVTGTFTGVSPGLYKLALDLKDTSSGATIFSEVYYYVSVV
jgi:hypothetical protein